MANGGYTGALPARDDSPEAYSGVWESQEQYAELAAGRWAQQAAGLALRSVRFNSADSSRFTRTVRTAGNRKTWTWSGWVKRTALGSNQLLFGSSSLWTELFFNSSNQLQVYAEGGSIPAGGIYLYSNAVFRDTSAWMHVVWVLDTTQPTAANRLRVYVNGQQITWTTSVSFDQNLDFNVNSANIHGIGSRVAENNLYLNAYLASVYFIDGQALEPEAFGFFDGSGVWQPRPFKGQYANRTGPVYSNGVTGSYTSGWTAGLGPDVLFNGDLNTLTDQVDSGPTGVPGYLYWTPATPIPVTSSLRIYGRWYTSSIGNPYLVSDEVSINGNPYVAPGNGTTANQWANLSSYLSTYSITTITNITWRSNPTAANRLDPAMGAIEVDGNILVEPSTGRNSFYLDFSDNSATTATALGADRSGNQNNWSPTNLAVAPAAWYKDANFAVGAQTGGTDLPATAMFDGNLASAWGAGRGPGTLKWVLTNAVSIPAGTLEVNAFGGPGDYQGYWYVTVKNAAGTTLTSQNITSNTAAWYSLGSGLGNIKEIWLTFDGGWNPGAAYAGGAIHEFRIGSQVLVWNDNFSFNDSLLDSPVNGRQSDTGLGGQVQGNYATLNPLKNPGGSTTFSNGNLEATFALSGNFPVPMGTFGVSSGQWYWEITPTSGASGSGGVGIGIGNAQCGPTTAGAFGVTANGWGYYYNGNKYNNNNSLAYGASYTNNDVIGVALNCDTGTLTFYKNGVSQGVAYTGLTSGPYFPAMGNAGDTSTCSCNFGQRQWAYQAPAGFKALCTANLPVPVIAKPSTVMDVLLWSGAGSNRSFSSLDMSPDFVWIKQRNQAFSTGHQLYDIVRGAGSDKELNSAGTAAEGAGNIDQYGWLSSFDSNGFSVTAGPIGADYVNAPGTTYVAWAWDAGTSTVTDGSGSIQSTRRTNPSAGFSVVTYTGNGLNGATVAHGLNATPSMILYKRRNGVAQDWGVWHTSGGLKLMQLNTASSWWNSAANYWESLPTSTMIYPDNSNGDHYQNISGANYVAYCFASVTGFSSFGSYSGDGSTSGFGPFIHCGFRPRLIIIKGATIAHDWLMLDSVRNPYNLTTQVLYANNPIAEMTNNGTGSGGYESIDILSNGFQIKSNSARYNQAGASYIYAAFAEHPFSSARAR